MESRTTVAHLVTPYLFQTGSWIHSQLVRNREFRPIVVTQGTEHLEMFPFDPVFDLSPRSRGAARLGFLFSKFVGGRFPAGPYREIFAREGVGLVHAHLGWEGARTAHLARNPRLPFVVSFYGRDASLLPRKAYWRVLYKRLFRAADRVLAEGPHMGRILAEIGAPADRVRVVHLGIPLDEFPFAERRDPGDDPVVGLIAAAYREKKGILYALDAMARVAPKHPRLRLRIIGDGPQRAEILARTQAQDLAGRVTLLGYEPYSVYKEELKRAHFLMAPSVTAADGDTEGGAPVCLLEAQASGLPVVASTHCDIPEVTRPGLSAFLAPERDTGALADCLEQLLSQPERWPEMGRAGRAYMEAEFDIDRQVARTNDIYREIL
jgi:colanic acid/amylovoran biosynthesis glycosyltransferase